MREIIKILWGWIVFFGYYLSPGVIIIAVTYLLTHNKFKWHREEVRVLFVPFLIWFLLNLFVNKGKSLSNIIELRYISVGIGIINMLSALATIFLKTKSTFKPKFDILVSTLLAITIYFVYPILPE